LKSIIGSSNLIKQVLRRIEDIEDVRERMFVWNQVLGKSDLNALESGAKALAEK
jgi:hypothetical protein